MGLGFGLGRWRAGASGSGLQAGLLASLRAGIRVLVGLIWYCNDVSIAIAMVSSIAIRQLAIVDLIGEGTATAELVMKFFFRLLILTYDVRNPAEICRISDVIIL